MDNELIRMLTEHLRYEKAILGTLAEIKYELQNARVRAEQKPGTGYIIVSPDPAGKPGRIRAWIEKWL